MWCGSHLVGVGGVWYGVATYASAWGVGGGGCVLGHCLIVGVVCRDGVPGWFVVIGVQCRCVVWGGRVVCWCGVPVRVVWVDGGVRGSE